MNNIQDFLYMTRFEVFWAQLKFEVSELSLNIVEFEYLKKSQHNSKKRDNIYVQFQYGSMTRI